MKRITLIIILALSALSTVRSQNIVVSGTITDRTDGQPITGVNIILKGTTTGTISDFQGKYKLEIPVQGGILIFSSIGYVTQEVAVRSSKTLNIQMAVDHSPLQEIVVTAEKAKKEERKVSHTAEESEASHILRGYASGVVSNNFRTDQIASSPTFHYQVNPVPQNREDYAEINENRFIHPLDRPLSTFSIDVDAASYANIRRFLNSGQRPPKDAVRIEEMINYFTYDYKQPKGDNPFSINTEISSAPWNEKHKLVHIGLQGRKIATENLPASNLVFLIDVSGSMSSANKLPLLKSAFKLLVKELRPEDNVAIVVYAGAAGLVLPSTPGNEKGTILNALENLSAGGSTAGGAGIKLAYSEAKKNFKEGGNNRVIIATDGDFNVGASSNDAMEKLIEEKREEGVFLTALGFGTGNYQDSKMEILADKGNGNYAYIDNILEANKVFVNEFGGTLFTIAKDVKIQVEFNPAKVESYRLIGYENRILAKEDFNNDKKDAGDLGAGHTVTALYEIIPVGVKSEFTDVDELKYQKERSSKLTQEALNSKELMTVKLRYKKPDEKKSKLIVHELIDNQVRLAKTSDNFRWSAAVAGFGMMLRDSEFIGALTYEQIIDLAKGAKGVDDEGYRAEFIRMAKSFSLIAQR
ncbi:MAG: von Willebrand factor type A domain-containing protein [Bacteroidota bacterium]